MILSDAVRPRNFSGECEKFLKNEIHGMGVVDGVVCYMDACKRKNIGNITCQILLLLQNVGDKPILLLTIGQFFGNIGPDFSKKHFFINVFSHSKQKAHQRIKFVSNIAGFNDIGVKLWLFVNAKLSARY